MRNTWLVTASRSNAGAETDPLVMAADNLAQALRETVSDAMLALERLDHFRQQRRRGMEYHEMVANQPARSVVEMLSDCQDRLAAAGARFRRETVRMLSAEGISQADIARRFGVTRQRVAALLAEEADPSELPIA